jgi:hypothetical protein
MSDQDSSKALENIVRIIHQHAEGALRSQIEALLPADADTRKLQRQLATLERNGWIVSTGAGHDTHYRVTPMAIAKLSPADAAPGPSTGTNGGTAESAAKPPVDLEAMITELIRYIVRSAGLPTSQARGVIQDYAISKSLDDATAIALEERTMAILVSLTEDEAETQYRIDPG